MLNIATVQVGNYLGRGREYVERLYDGISTFMPHMIRWKAVCLTDDASLLPAGVEARPVPEDIEGWWNKLALFKGGMFPVGERVLSFDLDVLPIGSLYSLAAYRGRFAMMADPYHDDHLNSSVMAWEAGTADDIWTIWDRSFRPQFDRRGDQFWIESLRPKADRWQAIAPGQVVSYKADCRNLGKPPAGAKLVVFHGQPRPHECTDEWVQQLWNGRRAAA